MLIILCTSYGRIVPHNYILLFVFTLSEGYSLSFVGFYNKGIILTAAILTLSITLSLSLYAMTTKNDLTLSGGIFFILFAKK